MKKCNLKSKARPYELRVEAAKREKKRIENLIKARDNAPKKKIEQASNAGIVFICSGWVGWVFYEVYSRSGERWQCGDLDQKIQERNF
jgi:hypothetical protein